MTQLRMTLSFPKSNEHVHVCKTTRSTSLGDRRMLTQAYFPDKGRRFTGLTTITFDETCHMLNDTMNCALYTLSY